jgi:hypothetical protein
VCEVRLTTIVSSPFLVLSVVCLFCVLAA